MKIFTYISSIKFASEQLILYSIARPEYEPRYLGVSEWCNSNIEYVDDPEQSDVLVLPHKFINTQDDVYISMSKMSKYLNKPLLCFYIDDIDTSFNIDENTILYRTSMYSSTRLPNEKAMPPIIQDHFDGFYLDKPELSVGYVGHCLHGRKKYVDDLLRSSLKTDFSLRPSCYFSITDPEDKNKQRQDFIENLRQNLFIFCYRGAGNFSYRFYETMMMGRIPVLIDTDCYFPSDLDVKDFCVCIKDSDLKNRSIETIITEYYNKNKENLVNIQRRNRHIWEKYFSPIGFLDSVVEDIMGKKEDINFSQRAFDGFGHQLHGLITCMALGGIRNYKFDGLEFIEKEFVFDHVGKEESVSLKRFMVDSVKSFMADHPREKINYSNKIHAHETYVIPSDHDPKTLYTVDNSFRPKELGLNPFELKVFDLNLKYIKNYFQRHLVRSKNYTDKIVIHVRMGDMMKYKSESINRYNAKLERLIEILDSKYPDRHYLIHSDGDVSFLEKFLKKYTVYPKSTPLLDVLSDFAFSDIIVCGTSSLSTIGSVLGEKKLVIHNDDSKNALGDFWRVSEYIKNLETN